MSDTVKREKAIGRLKKIMERATHPGTPDHEVDAALEMAAQLMAAHRIEEHELQDEGGAHATAEGIEVWHVTVVNTRSTGPMRRDAFAWIGEAFGARALASRIKNGSGGTQGFKLHLYATGSVLDQLKVIIPALQLQAENRLKKDLAAKTAELKADHWLGERDRKRTADQYAKGWWHAYGSAAAQKIRATRTRVMDEAMGSGKGELVRQSDTDRVNAHIAAFGKLKKAGGTRTAYDRDALRAGQQAGREALVGQDEIRTGGEQRPALT